MGGTRHVLTVVAALAVAALSGWLAVVGLIYGFGLKCDESCEDGSPKWQDDPGAWQWNALGLTTIALFALSLVVLVLAAKRRHQDAGIAFCAWLLLGMLWWVVFIEPGFT